MDTNHLDREIEQKARRRHRKKKPRMKMHGKRTREIPRFWKKRAGH